MPHFIFQRIDYASADYSKVVQLRSLVLRQPLGLRFSINDLKPDQHELIFALMLENKPVACVQIKPLSKTQVKLRQMAINPDFQRRGLGKMLIQKVEAYLQTQGFRNIELNARKTALEFYQKSGYKIASDEFFEIGLPHFKMIKKI